MSRRTWTIAAAVAISLSPAAAQRNTSSRQVEWPYYVGDQGGVKYSALADIGPENISRLKIAWEWKHFDVPLEQYGTTPGQFEAVPLMHDGVLYVTTNSATIAVDAKTGKQIWKTKVEWAPETPRVVCCGIINRGAALYEGKVIRGTLDAKLVALDAKTGKQLWKSDVADVKQGYTVTGAPQIADGVIITGISGAEFGTRDFIDGWEPETGKHLWRTYSIPSPDEPGGDTWKGDTWKLGGGSTWITGSLRDSPSKRCSWKPIRNGPRATAPGR